LKPLNSRSNNQRIAKNKLQSEGLGGVSSTLIIPGTEGTGLLKIGKLASLTKSPDSYQPILNSKNNPVIGVETAEKYFYFFLQFENVFVPRSDEVLYSFAVVITLEPSTINSVSSQIGISTKNIKGLTFTEYENNSFLHPTYLNQDNQSLSIRYAELATLIQTTPGRLDNIPLGYPDFPFSRSPITTQIGILPQPPIPNFLTSLGQTGGTAISVGGTVGFVDSSIRTPDQVSPSSWDWYFGGSGASPTGSTQQNPIVTFGLTGSYSITLTSSNLSGSSSITKNFFVIVN
jgi:PKD repeat protein